MPAAERTILICFFLVHIQYRSPWWAMLGFVTWLDPLPLHSVPTGVQPPSAISWRTFGFRMSQISSPVLGAKLLWKTAAPHRVRFFFWLLLAQEVLDWGSEISTWSTAFKILRVSTLSPQGRANAIASEGRVLGLGRVQAAGAAAIYSLRAPAPNRIERMHFQLCNLRPPLFGTTCCARLWSRHYHFSKFVSVSNFILLNKKRVVWRGLEKNNYVCIESSPLGHGPRRRRDLRRQRDANWRDGGGMAWHKLELGRPGRAFSSSIVR